MWHLLCLQDEQQLRSLVAYALGLLNEHLESQSGRTAGSTRQRILGPALVDACSKQRPSTMDDIMQLSAPGFSANARKQYGQQILHTLKQV